MGLAELGISTMHGSLNDVMRLPLGRHAVEVQAVIFGSLSSGAHVCMYDGLTNMTYTRLALGDVF